MISKEEFKSLVDRVGLSKNMTQGEVSKDMGYGENYISEMLTEKGKLSEKFVSAFSIKYSDILENPNGASKKSFDNLTEAILILTRNNERLVTLLETNLSASGEASQPSQGVFARQRNPVEYIPGTLDKQEIHSDRKKKEKRKDIASEKDR